MMPKLKDFGLYFITDSTLTRKSVIEDAKSAVKAGVKIIQYREKNAPTRQMMQEALKIKEICKSNDVLFLVNDRLDIAIAVDADGVHIGQDDMPYDVARRLLGNNKIIGVTVHNSEEAIEAEKKGADYLGLSPIFPTSTKKNAGNACGPKMIVKVRAKASIPVVAIGGINDSNIDEVMRAGATNVAIISAIITKNDVTGAARFFIEKINHYK